MHHACGGKTRRIKTRQTRLGSRQVRVCLGCGTRIYLKTTVEREEPAPQLAAGSTSPLSTE